MGKTVDNLVLPVNLSGEGQGVERMSWAPKICSGDEDTLALTLPNTQGDCYYRELGETPRS